MGNPLLPLHALDDLSQMILHDEDIALSLQHTRLVGGAVEVVDHTAEHEDGRVEAKARKPC